MRVRSYLLTSVAAAGLLCFSPIALHQAHAQKGAFMAPSTEWVVNKVAGAAGDGYCAVARRFDGNTILTIARNEASETSFALDFPMLKFKPSKKMAVTLDPGAGLQREYNIKPLSQKAFVIRLGEDSDFFGALARTGLLRVEAAGESYVFDVSDIDVGQSELDGCLSSFKEPELPAVPPAAVQVDAMAPVPVDAQGRGKPKALLADIDLSAPVLAEVKDPETLRAENLRLRAMMQTGEKPALPVKDVSALKEKLDEAKSENAKLLREVEKIERRATGSGQDGERLGKLSELKSENIALQMRVHNLTQSLQGYKAIDEQLSSLESERNELRSALKSAQNGRAGLAHLSADKLSSLAEQNQRLLGSIKGAREAIGDVVELRKQVQNVRRENAYLKADAEALKDTRLQLARLNHEVEIVSEQKLLAETRIAALEQKLVTKGEGSSIEQSLLSRKVQQKEEKVAALNAEIERLKADSREQSIALVQTQVQLAELTDLQTSNEGLQIKLASFSERFSENKLKTESSKRALEQENAQIMAENEALKVKMGSLEDALQLAYVDGAGSAQHEQAISELRTKNETLQDQLEFAHATINASEAVKKQNVTLRETLELALAKIENLNADKETLNQQLAMAALGGGDGAPKREDTPEPIKVALASVSSDVPKPSQKPSISKRVLDRLRGADDAAVERDDKPSVVHNVVEETLTAEVMALASLSPAAGDEAGADIDVVQEAQDIMLRDLSEAQIYEEQMKRKIENEQRVVKEDAASVSVEAPVEVRLSEDPFAPIEVKKPEIMAVEPMESIESIVSEPAVIRNDIVTVPKIPSAGELEAKNPVQRAVGKVTDSVKKVVAPEPKSAPAIVTEAPAVNVSTTIADLLGAAKVAAPADVRRVDSASGASITAYQWRAGDAYGSGEQKSLPKSSAFDGFVKEYLTRTETRCKGDFAIVPDDSREKGAMRADSYEVACVGAGISSGAALLFFNEGGTFNVVAHEIDAEQMDIVMQIRDKIFATLMSGS